MKCWGCLHWRCKYLHTTDKIRRIKLLLITVPALPGWLWKTHFICLWWKAWSPWTPQTSWRDGQTDRHSCWKRSGASEECCRHWGPLNGEAWATEMRALLPHFPLTLRSWHRPLGKASKDTKRKLRIQHYQLPSSGISHCQQLWAQQLAVTAPSQHLFTLE